MAKRRKKVSEETYNVTKHRSNVGDMDTDSETVDAANSAEAAEKSIADDPRAGRYQKVEIEKSKGGTSRVRTEPRTTSAIQSKTEPMNTSLESISYPYNIGLPKEFEPLIEALTKKTKKSLDIRERYSRLHITVPNALAMKELVEELGKKSRGRTKVKSIAGVIYEGITKSI